MAADKKRVFVVDDDDINLTLMHGILEDDYQVQCFTSGKGCLQAFEEDPADIVLLDVVMPDLDGLETCRRLLEIEPQCPVLFVSAKNSSKERIEGYNAGGYDYIVKPCDGNELLAKLQVITQQQEQKQQMSMQNQNITKAFMEVTAGSGEQGILIRFAVAVSETHSHQELAEALIYALNELDGLKASVLIKGKNKTLFWSNNGPCPPIETQVLETLVDKGRIYEFHNRIQVNEKYVSALIKNMPEDEMVRGRFRDHIPLLLQIASARSQNQDTEESLTNTEQRMEVIHDVCNQLTDADIYLHKHISSFIYIIEDELERIRNEIQHLALSEEQEEKLFSSLETALDQSLISGVEAINVCSRFGGIVSKLKETF